MPLYKHGLPFSQIIANNLEDLEKRRREKFASLIIIDGGLGKGKTTLAVHCCDYFNKKNGIPATNLNDQYGAGGDEFEDKLRVAYDKKLPAVIYDEAGDFNRRGALTRFNAMLNRTFEIFRAFNVIPILCLPSFFVLDNDLFLKEVPRLLLHVRSRDRRSANIWGYSLYRMYYLRKKMRDITVTPQAYSFVDPNFYGHSLDLEPARSEELDQKTTQKKAEIGEKTVKNYENMLNLTEIAQKLKYSRGYIGQLVYKLRLKPAKKLGPFKYFSKDQIRIISDNIGVKL